MKAICLQENYPCPPRLLQNRPCAFHHNAIEAVLTRIYESRLEISYSRHSFMFFLCVGMIIKSYIKLTPRAWSERCIMPQRVCVSFFSMIKQAQKTCCAKQSDCDLKHGRPPQRKPVKLGRLQVRCVLPAPIVPQR